jgi:hypothetical protein
MAVNKIASSKSIAIEVQNGTDSKGDPTYTKKSFSGVKTDVDTQNAYDVAEAIKGVLVEPTRAYFLNSTSTLETA